MAFNASPAWVSLVKPFSRQNAVVPATADAFSQQGANRHRVFGFSRVNRLHGAIEAANSAMLVECFVFELRNSSRNMRTMASCGGATQRIPRNSKKRLFQVGPVVAFAGILVMRPVGFRRPTA